MIITWVDSLYCMYRHAIVSGDITFRNDKACFICDGQEYSISVKHLVKVETTVEE